MKNQTPNLQENKMGVMRMGRLLFDMALPLSISMLVQAMYNVVDSIYVSRISESAVAALSMAFPIQNLMIGVATGVAVGVNSLLSKSLGEGNQEKANRCAGNGIVITMVSVMLFMLFGFFGARPFFAIQSQIAETVNGGTSYIAICSIFSLGIFVEILFERFLQASGRTVYSMITQTTGAIINIVLDPILIFGWFGIPAMGIAGAAIATVIGQWVAAILAIIFNLKWNPEVRFTKNGLRPSGKLIGNILGIGVPSVVMMAIGSIMTFSMNQILQGFTETATSVFGIYFKLQSFIFMPVFGVNNASVSIVAFNYGARKPERITGTIKRVCVVNFCIMLTGLAVFQFAPDFLLSFFKPSPAFLEMGRSALRTISFSFPLAAFGISLGGSFQGLGNGIYATIISICRQLVVLIPVAFLMSLTGDVQNVWWAFPIAEVCSIFVSLFFYSRIYKQRIKPLFDEKKNQIAK